jgi:hypothetical protein
MQASWSGFQAHELDDPQKDNCNYNRPGQILMHNFIFGNYQKLA